MSAHFVCAGYGLPRCKPLKLSESVILSFAGYVELVKSHEEPSMPSKSIGKSKA